MTRGRPKGSKNKPKESGTMASQEPNTESQRVSRRVGLRDFSIEPEAESTGWKEAFTEFKEQLRNDFDRSISLLERNLGAAIELLDERVTDIERYNVDQSKQIKDITTDLRTNLKSIEKNAEAVNKLERQSRKKNFRVVGIERTNDEDCILIIRERVLSKLPNGDKIQIERAHRDGKGARGKPPHILARCHSFQDKVEVMKNWRTCLGGAEFFIVDDLTRVDLSEKKSRSEKVKQLYSQGVKLRFVAGRWRDTNGKPFPFE